jgi:DNA primase
MAAKDYTTVEAAGREVRISSPSREYFPAHGGRPAITKLDLVEYHLAVADALINHLTPCAR